MWCLIRNVTTKIAHGDNVGIMYSITVSQLQYYWFFWSLIQFILMPNSYKSTIYSDASFLFWCLVFTIEWYFSSKSISFTLYHSKLTLLISIPWTALYFNVKYQKDVKCHNFIENHNKRQTPRQRQQLHLNNNNLTTCLVSLR